MKTYNFPPGMGMGRMISWSKSSYCDRFPNHLVIFNSNLVIPSEGKIWYGDIDVHVDKEMLCYFRGEIDEDLYFLNERDGRFDHENDDPSILISKAVFVVRQDKIQILDEWLIEKFGNHI